MPSKPVLRHFSYKNGKPTIYGYVDLTWLKDSSSDEDDDDDSKVSKKMKNVTISSSDDDDDEMKNKKVDDVMYSSDEEDAVDAILKAYGSKEQFFTFLRTLSAEEVLKFPRSLVDEYVREREAEEQRENLSVKRQKPFEERPNPTFRAPSIIQPPPSKTTSRLPPTTAAVKQPQPPATRYPPPSATSLKPLPPATKYPPQAATALKVLPSAATAAVASGIPPPTATRYPQPTAAATTTKSMKAPQRPTAAAATTKPMMVPPRATAATVKATGSTAVAAAAVATQPSFRTDDVFDEARYRYFIEDSEPQLIECVDCFTKVNRILKKDSKLKQNEIERQMFPQSICMICLYRFHLRTKRDDPITEHDKNQTLVACFHCFGRFTLHLTDEGERIKKRELDKMAVEMKGHGRFQQIVKQINGDIDEVSRIDSLKGILLKCQTKEDFKKLMGTIELCDFMVKHADHYESVLKQVEIHDPDVVQFFGGNKDLFKQKVKQEKIKKKKKKKTSDDFYLFKL